MSQATPDAVSRINKLADQAKYLAIDSARGEPIVRLGLIATLYFKQSHTAETKQRLAECFAEFHKAFGRQLKWQFYKTLRKMTASSFAHCRRKMLRSPPDEQFIWSIGSGNLQQVADYRMFVMNTPQAQAEIDGSCLKMVMPWSVLLQPDGAERYERWLKYLCNQLNAEHGYGGLACTLPYDGQKYFSHEHRLAETYIGLMVDPLAHIDSLRLLDHVKGVSWFTVVGNRFVQQLGGSDALRRSLSGCSEIVFQTYRSGLIIRAGSLPTLGGPGEPIPAAYVEVNKAIRPVRVRNVGCLHPCSSQGHGFSEASSALWYARFDEKSIAALKAGANFTRCVASGLNSDDK